MSVNAIGLPLYSTSLQYKYFSAYISEDRLNDLLEKYGIISTGDRDKDLDTLHRLMYAEAVKEVEDAQGASNQTPKVKQANNQAIESATSNEVPWANLMTQVGLSATGDLNEDYIAFMNQIQLMKRSGASSQSDKAYIDQLMAQASVVFVQPETIQTSSAKAPSASTPAPQQPSGVDILAQLNKMYIVGY